MENNANTLHVFLLTLFPTMFFRLVFYLTMSPELVARCIYSLYLKDISRLTMSTRSSHHRNLGIQEALEPFSFMEAYAFFGH